MWAINLRCYYYLVCMTTQHRVVHFTFPFFSLSPLLAWKCSMEGKWKEVVHKCYHIFHKFYYGFCFSPTLPAFRFVFPHLLSTPMEKLFCYKPLNFFFSVTCTVSSQIITFDIQDRHKGAKRRRKAWTVKKFWWEIWEIFDSGKFFFVMFINIYNDESFCSKNEVIN